MAPSSIVCGLQVDSSTFTNEQFPSDFRYQFHTEDRVYYKTELAFTLDEVRIPSLPRSFTPIEVRRHPCQHYRSPKQRSPASRAADRFSPLRPLRYLQCHRRDRRAPRLERSLQRVRLCSAFHPTRFHHRYHRSHSLSLFIHQQNGRHPLQELVTDHFIPNGFHVSTLEEVNIVDRAELPFHRDSDRSEQQREVGVPQADRSARLSDPDRLLRSSGARLSESVPLHPHKIQHDRKVWLSRPSLRSVADFDSSFTQDLTRISWLSKAVSERSLVLIDEFGKGTAPQGSIRSAC